MSLKVSIAIATYNGEKYLGEQLESFLAQTRLPDEVIISDDNSSDRTLEIAEAFKQKAPFDVVILSNEQNLGYTKNFEKSLLETSGDLVLMSDQDDVWFEHKIERIVDEAEGHPEYDLIVHDTEIVNEDLESTGITKMDKIIAIGNDLNSMVMGTCTAVSKKLLSLCFPMPKNYVGHDTWLHNIANILDTKLVIREVLQYYRIHGENTSTNILNNPDKINLIDLINWKFDASREIQKMQVQIENKAILSEWLSNHEIGLSSSNKNKIIQELSSEVSATKKRVKIYELNRIQRVAPILKMYLKGDYKYFKGLKSVTKDFLIE